jgi:hypothetical protein
MKQNYFIKIYADGDYNSDFEIAEISFKADSDDSARVYAATKLTWLMTNNIRVKWALTVEKWANTSKNTRKHVWSRQDVLRAIPK